VSDVPNRLSATKVLPEAGTMADTPRLKQIEAMLADDPNDVMLRYMLGMEYASGGDDEGAVREFSKLTDAASEEPYVPAFHMAGQALARLGREPDAANVLRRGIEAARKIGDLHALGEMETLLATVE
jgi:thioredoxin-like negative regulator of GroEL